jgi:hypothetical protein
MTWIPSHLNYFLKSGPSNLQGIDIRHLNESIQVSDNTTLFYDQSMIPFKGRNSELHAGKTQPNLTKELACRAYCFFFDTAG